MKIKKEVIVKEIAETSGLSQKQVRLVMDIINNTYTAHIKAGNELHVLDICAVKSQLSKATTRKNPKTGVAINVPEKIRVKARMLPSFNK